MQMELAHRDGVLIPEQKAEPEDPKRPDELLAADRGGLVFVPKLGFTPNVAELDFVSQFPSIMARFNISPETVNCPCCPESYLQKLEVARGVFANYEDRLANGEVDIRDLVVTKRITREPRDYQKAGVTAIAAQQLYGSGVKLRPGQNIEYVITNAEAHVPNDRVRAYALWEGWFGYDRKKYVAMLREAFEPFALCAPKRAEPVLLEDSVSPEDLKRFPLFASLTISRT